MTPPASLGCPVSTPALVDIIDFKWLMAHEGHRVHVERLQSDAGYARECLALAAASTTAALRAAARRVALALTAAAA